MRVPAFLRPFFFCRNSANEKECVISSDNIFMGVEELKEQDSAFYEYLTFNNIPLKKNFFPFNKYTGQTYKFFPDLAIAPAKYYLNQRKNNDIAMHAEEVYECLEEITQNQDVGWFMMERNGCALSGDLKNLTKKLSFITPIGIGKPFTFNTLVREVASINGAHIVMINNIPQLIFDCKIAIREKMIEEAEIQYILMLRKLTFKTVISKTQDLIYRLPISNDLKERLTIEGMVSEKEIIELGSIVTGRFVFTSLFNGKPEKSLLFCYLALNLDAKLSDKKWRSKLIKVIDEKYFESKEVYESYQKVFTEKIQSIKKESDSINPLAYHYVNFCRIKRESRVQDNIIISNMNSYVNDETPLLVVSGRSLKEKDLTRVSSFNNRQSLRLN